MSGTIIYSIIQVQNLKIINGISYSNINHQTAFTNIIHFTFCKFSNSLHHNCYCYSTNYHPLLGYPIEQQPLNCSLFLQNYSSTTCFKVSKFQNYLRSCGILWNVNYVPICKKHITLKF